VPAAGAQYFAELPLIPAQPKPVGQSVSVEQLPPQVPWVAPALAIRHCSPLGHGVVLLQVTQLVLPPVVPPLPLVPVAPVVPVLPLVPAGQVPVSGMQAM
jgi:hypothetical protein